MRKLIKKILLAFLPLSFAGCPYNDTITLDRNRPGEQGALVDGVKDGTFQNDQIFSTSLEAGFSVGNFMASSGENRGEIIGFSQGHPPALMTPANWTNRSDSMNVSLEAEYSIPVYVWIVVARGNSEKVRTGILLSRHIAEQIWTDEKQGIRLHLPSSHIKDVRNKKDRNGKTPSQRYRYNAENDFFTFTCTTLLGNERNVINDIGFEENAINVYYLDHVQGLDGDGSNYAVSCKENVTINGQSILANVIVMGSDTGEDLLIHEFGHQFALEHVQENITEEDPCPKDPKKPPYFPRVRHFAKSCLINRQ
jgi:hypothetical protein